MSKTVVRVRNGSLATILEPLGRIGDAINAICTYSIEVQRLQLERRQIELDAAAEHARIEAVRAALLAEVRERYRGVMEFLAMARSELKEERLNRELLRETLRQVRDRTADPSLASEERLMFIDATKHLSSVLAGAGTNAVAALEACSRAVQSSLEGSGLGDALKLEGARANRTKGRG